MTRSRRLLANLLVLGVVAGSAAAIGTGHELWPFSPYPMFSRTHRGPTVERLWVYGVLPDGREVPLSDRRAFHPLRLAQLEAALTNLGPAGRREGLEDMLSRYEVRRGAGRHGGPRFTGLRLYRMAFELEDDAGNRDRPLVRELLAEVAGETR